MARAIVAGHGTFAHGMVSAVSVIAGHDDILIPFSNADLGREEIESQLKDLLVRSNIRVIFIDLQNGSVGIAARRILRTMPDLVLVTGANLPALIDFALSSSKSPKESADHAAERGRSAIDVLKG